MGKLTDIADEFGLSVELICEATGRSRPDLQRILEPDSIIYPGELKELLTELLMMSYDICEAEIERAKADNRRRKKYLETMSKRQGIHLGYNEDTFEF